MEEFNWWVWFASVSGLVASWITIFEFVRRKFKRDDETKLGEFLSGQKARSRSAQIPATETPVIDNISAAKQKFEDESQENIKYENWAHYFIKIFDTIFRPNGMFLISIPRSLIATSLGITISAGLVTSVAGTESWVNYGSIMGKNIWIAVFFILISNYIADWLSLAETRIIIELFRKSSQKFLSFLALVIIDYYITFILPIFIGIIVIDIYFIVSRDYAMDVIINDLSKALMLPYAVPAECVFGQEFEFFDGRFFCSNPYMIVPFITTFITSIWFIAFAFATWISRWPIRWFRGSKAQAITDPFAVLVLIFSVLSFAVLALIPLSLLTTGHPSP